MAWPSEGVVADCNSGAIAASLLGRATWSAQPFGQPPSPSRGRPDGLGAVAFGLLALQRPHVGGLGALRPRRDVELDSLPLFERAVAVGLDRAEMHEDVRAGLGRNEAIALVGVEPLHGSNRHELVPPLHRLGGSRSTPARSGASGKGQAQPADAKANHEPLRRYPTTPTHEAARMLCLVMAWNTVMGSGYNPTMSDDGGASAMTRGKRSPGRRPCSARTRRSACRSGTMTISMPCRAARTSTSRSTCAGRR